MHVRFKPVGMPEIICEVPDDPEDNDEWVLVVHRVTELFAGLIESEYDLEEMSNGLRWEPID